MSGDHDFLNISATLACCILHFESITFVKLINIYHVLNYNYISYLEIINFQNVQKNTCFQLENWLNFNNFANSIWVEEHVILV